MDSQGELELALQEIAKNIEKHSRARNVNIVTSIDVENLEVTIKDDGVGFIPDAVLTQAPLTGHFGLLGIRERIESSPGKGTALVVVVPVIC